MARLHSRKRGRSGSKKPTLKVAPEWVEYSGHEVEGLVLKLAKQGLDATHIGLILRDQYGIPTTRAVCGKRVSDILKDNKTSPDFPDDLLNLIKRAVGMRKHLEENTRDIHNKTKLIHVESKIRRLAKYYVKKGKVPEGWAYDPKKAALLVK